MNQMMYSMVAFQKFYIMTKFLVSKKCPVVEEHASNVLNVKVNIKV